MTLLTPIIAAAVAVLTHRWANAQRWKEATLRHLRGPLAHPHHFVTAGLLTGMAHAFGHASTELVIGAFCYAIAETLVEGAD